MNDADFPIDDSSSFDPDNFNLASPDLDYLDNDDAPLIAGAGDDLIASNDYCPSLNSDDGQFQKRGTQCPSADAPAPALKVPTFPNLLPSDNNPEPPPEGENDDLKLPLRRLYEGTDESKCYVHGLIPYVHRTVEVCCAERGPHVLDQWARLIYNNLLNCENCKSKGYT